MADSPTLRLKQKNIVLPPPPKPAGTYTPVVVDNGRAWVSGQIVTESGSVVSPGLVDRDVTLDEAQQLARRATLQALSALQATVGSIDRIAQVVRVGVYVASSPGFERQHVVGNGATDLLVELFDERGRPARVSMGVASLPLNAPVEVELMVALG